MSLLGCHFFQVLESFISDISHSFTYHISQIHRSHITFHMSQIIFHIANVASHTAVSTKQHATCRVIDRSIAIILFQRSCQPRTVRQGNWISCVPHTWLSSEWILTSGSRLCASRHGLLWFGPSCLSPTPMKGSCRLIGGTCVFFCIRKAAQNGCSCMSLNFLRLVLLKWLGLMILACASSSLVSCSLWWSWFCWTGSTSSLSSRWRQLLRFWVWKRQQKVAERTPWNFWQASKGTSFMCKMSWIEMRNPASQRKFQRPPLTLWIFWWTIST